MRYIAPPFKEARPKALVFHYPGDYPQSNYLAQRLTTPIAE
jgi:hypothetical protein